MPENHITKVEINPHIEVNPKINTSQENPIRPEKKEKKRWYKTIWGIIVGIGIILALIWTSIQIHDRFNNKSENQELDQKNKQIKNEEKIDSTSVKIKN